MTSCTRPARGVLVLQPGDAVQAFARLALLVIAPATARRGDQETRRMLRRARPGQLYEVESALAARTWAAAIRAGTGRVDRWPDNPRCRRATGDDRRLRHASASSGSSDPGSADAP